MHRLQTRLQSHTNCTLKGENGIIEELKMLCSKDASTSLERVTNLFWRLITMNTLPPHANNGNTLSTSGIYKITCLPTSKIYVGSAVNLRSRKNTHFGTLRRSKHANSHLQRAWDKYGEAAFTFEVLEYVLIPEMLTAREQHWFKELKPFGRRGFNMLPIAGSPSGYKHSPESIDKIRATHLGSKRSPEICEKMRQSRIGIKYNRVYQMTPEHREKLRQARLGTKSSPETCEKLRQGSTGRVHSPEHIEKQRQSVLGRKKSPEHCEKLRQGAVKRHELSSVELEAIRLDRTSGMTYRQIIKKYGIGGTRLGKIFRGDL